MLELLQRTYDPVYNGPTPITSLIPTQSDGLPSDNQVCVTEFTMITYAKRTNVFNNLHSCEYSLVISYAINYI